MTVPTIRDASAKVRGRLARSRRARAIYERTVAAAYLRLCSTAAAKRRLAPQLSSLPTSSLYSATGTGLDQRSELRMLQREAGLKGAEVLIVGVGGGDEILECWMQSGVDRIVAIDLVSEIDYKDSVGWATVKSRAAATGISVSFATADGTQMPFRDGSFDLVYSISLLEHLPDLGRFLAEAHRVLRRTGRIYSLFGPMWFTYGGPHVGQLGYEHLLLPRESFLDRVREVGDPWQVRWAEQDCYNRLTLEGYLQEFEKHFTVQRLAVAGSPDGERFRAERPTEWARLAQEFGEAALLTRLASVLATPN